MTRISKHCDRFIAAYEAAHVDDTESDAYFELLAAAFVDLARDVRDECELIALRKDAPDVARAIRDWELPQ